MAGAGLLLLNIYYLVSIDQFHEKKDRVFKVYNKTSVNGRLNCHGQSQAPLGPALQKEFPRIRQMARIAYPGYITELQFADEDVARTFQQRKNASDLINSFTLIAIFIACMGLLGLTAYMVEMRRREVGIRKVLGASVATVTSLLTKEFVKLVGIAVLIASPVAWLFMHLFLQQFSYRTNISWWILPVSGIVAIVIAIATISFQTIKNGYSQSGERVAQ